MPVVFSDIFHRQFPKENATIARSEINLKIIYPLFYTDSIMATEIVEKKKHRPRTSRRRKIKRLKHASLDSFCGIFYRSSDGNVYFKEAFSLPVRVVGVVVALLIAFGFAAITNQGTKARTFFSEAKVEARKVVWPTRAETRQTTLIVIAVTVLTSLFFWAIDSIIIALINFLTDLRF